jgi:single-stranded-DNA-specific exonuclease
MRDKHVEAARQEGVRLIVTADTGTRSFSAVRCAKSAAIDVVITDHHLPESRLPEAVAVVNPTRCDSAYANRSLCSAGLAFQIAAGLLRALQMPEKRAMALLRSFIKLAAIGTVADVVPLVGENRALVSLGLRALTTVRNPGLRALLDAAGIPDGRMPTGREIAFRLAPRINAAGRIGDASLIMNLLCTADQGRGTPPRPAS